MDVKSFTWNAFNQPYFYDSNAGIMAVHTPFFDINVIFGLLFFKDPPKIEFICGDIMSNFAKNQSSHAKIRENRRRVSVEIEIHLWLMTFARTPYFQKIFWWVVPRRLERCPFRKNPQNENQIQVRMHKLIYQYFFWKPLDLKNVFIFLVTPCPFCRKIKFSLFQSSST